MGICIKRRDTMQVAALGSSCSPADICSNGSECINSRCQCPQGREERAGFCVRLGQLGESCINGQFCPTNAICKAGVEACVCPLGASAVPDGCLLDREEEPWLNITTGQIDSSSIFRPEMRKAVPGDLCDVHTTCTNGSYCSAFGFCHCPEGYSEVYSLCVSTIKARFFIF
jgi:hypothetical protein